MRVLFTIGNGYLPQTFGGIQSSTHQLAARLSKDGHQAAVMCRLEGGTLTTTRSKWIDFRSRLQRRLTGNSFSVDKSMSYPVYRAWQAEDASEVIRRFRPEVAVIQQGPCMFEVGKSLLNNGIPVVIYLRDAAIDKVNWNFAVFGDAHYIANSQFNAQKYRQEFGIRSTVIPPLVEPGLYRTESTRETVTFINPTEQKGLRLALAVAAMCPQIPFSFVESWSIPDHERVQLVRHLANLKNVKLLPKRGNMKGVYGKTRILLAPSQCEEAWGRVATEAHVSGIPVIGANIGGLPEAVGPGGIVLPSDAPPQVWSDAVRRLWSDDSEYSRLSQQALLYSEREEMKPDNQFAMFMDVIRRAVKQ